MNPEIVIKLRNRMLALSAERPPLGELSEVMNPALPYVYGQAEDNSVSEKIRHHVEHARRSQQQIWEAGKYPWPHPRRMARLLMRVMVGNIVPSAIHSDVGAFSNVFLAAERSATRGHGRGC